MTDTEENLDETIERVKETLAELEKKKADQAKDKLKDLAKEYKDAEGLYQIAALGVLEARSRYLKAAGGIPPQYFWYNRS